MSNEQRGPKESIRNFEGLIAWQKARELVRRIYEITNSGMFSNDQSLRNQIRRAGISVMANLAEGYERASAKDFLRFVITAKASCAEVRSHLYIARDVFYLNPSDFEELFQRASELSRIMGGLRVSLQRKVLQTHKC